MSSVPQSRNHFLSNLFPIFAEKRNLDSLVFRPIDRTGGPYVWGRVTYSELEQHLLVSQSYWRRQLGDKGLNQGDVVGIWLTGRRYTDLVNVLGISAAGFIPQLFSVVFANPAVIWDLLSRSQAKSLIYDSEFSSDITASPVMTLSSLTLEHINSSLETGKTFIDLPEINERDSALIFHSSGTTSGTPKLIPTSHLLLKNFMTHKYASCIGQGVFEGQNVVNTLGNLAHVGSLQAFLGAAFQGTCTVQASSMNIPPEELVEMSKICGLNRLVQYATFLSNLIRNAKINPEVAVVLKNLRQILYTGVALNREDELWAYANGLSLTTMYGTSETAPLLTSLVGSSPDDHLLRPVVGASGQFILFTPSESATNDISLYELVVPTTAPDAPHSSLFSSDGLFHTGDLFEQPKVGRYLYRGRAGDWIKLLGGFCDTKYIEDNVRNLCLGLLHDAVVIGIGRPMPVLCVETIQNSVEEESRKKIAAEVIKRLESFNDRLFPYERFDDPRRILVLNKGVLPRTKEKGNVRRNATEEIFQMQLNAIFSS